MAYSGLLVTVISFVIFFKLAKQEGKAHIINISVLKNTSFNLGLLIYTFLQFIQISQGFKKLFLIGSFLAMAGILL